MADSGSIYQASFPNPHHAVEKVDIKPQFECGSFLAKKLLPNSENHRVLLSSLMGKKLFLVYTPKQESSIYFLYEIDLHTEGLISGKEAILNLTTKPLGIYSLSKTAVLIQTEE